MAQGGTRASGERAHRLGVVVNLALALLKIAGGWLSGSLALLADGYHSLADLVTNGVAWFSFRVAARPADADHHYGHGKAEAAAGVFVGLVLIGAGLKVLWDALGASGPVYSGPLALLAMGIAFVSVAANEWLVFVTKRAARSFDSLALAALARDNRSDSLTSVLVIVGVGGGQIGLRWAEPFVTAIIGALIMTMGGRSLRESGDILMDRVSDLNLRERILERARAVPGVRGVQTVKVHPLGGRHRVDMEISVDGELSVREGHAIAHAVEREVTSAMRAVDHVAVHVNPAEEAGPDERVPGP